MFQRTKLNIECWWCYPTPFEGWGTGTRPKVWARKKEEISRQLSQNGLRKRLWEEGLSDSAMFLKTYTPQELSNK